MSMIRECEFSCTREHLVIRGREFRPHGANRGAVIISHGFCQNRKDFLEYGRALASWGYAVYTFDFCGGCLPQDCTSDGSFLEMTVETQKRDLLAVIRYVGKLPYVEGTNLSLVGFSQGGLVSALVAAGNPELQIGNLILLSPALCIPDHARAGKLAGSSYDVTCVPQVISGGIMPVGRAYHEAVVSMNVFEEIRAYQGRVLIVHGKWDSVVDYHYSQQAYETYGSGKSELKLLENTDHGYTPQQRAVVFRLIREFLLGKC